MSMLNCFFSNKYEDREDLFEGLSVWKEDEYRKIQGIYPVLLLSFASVKADNAADARKQIKSWITSLYQDYEYLLESERLSDSEKLAYRRVLTDMADQADIYELRSNRESGFGRYDVMMIPRMECGQQSNGQHVGKAVHLFRKQLVEKCFNPVAHRLEQIGNDTAVDKGHQDAGQG